MVFLPQGNLFKDTCSSPSLPPSNTYLWITAGRWANSDHGTASMSWLVLSFPDLRTYAWTPVSPLLIHGESFEGSAASQVPTSHQLLPCDLIKCSQQLQEINLTVPIPPIRKLRTREIQSCSQSEKMSKQKCGPWFSYCETECCIFILFLNPTHIKADAAHSFHGTFSEHIKHSSLPY